MIYPIIFALITIFCVILSGIPVLKGFDENSDLSIYNISQSTILGNILIDLLSMMITVSFLIDRYWNYFELMMIISLF